MPDPLPEPAPAGGPASRQPTPASASGATPTPVPEPAPIPMITSDITSITGSIQSPVVASPIVPAPATNGITNLNKPFRPNSPAVHSHPAPAGPIPPVAIPRHPAPASAPRHSASPALAMTYHPHPNPTQQQAYVGRSDPKVAKPIIVDPPGTRISNGALQSSGFPSPSLDHSRVNPKFNEDVSRLTFAVKQAVPEAVRRVVRDNWEKCVLGSDFHHAFVMNASIHRANPTITKRAIKDFGAQLVSVGRREIVELFTAKDIDEVAEMILSKASNAFLDRALERRLSTIEAKPLINALARAERLGYERGDIVEEQGVGQGEKVIPQEKRNVHQPHHPQPPQMMPSQAPMPAQMPHPATPGTVGVPPQQYGQWQCDQCFRIFHAKSAHDHHVRKTVCKRAAPTPEGFKFSCPHCGQGFTTAVGLKYHIDNKVCGDFVEQPALLPTPQSVPVAQMGGVASTPGFHQGPTAPSTPSSNGVLKTVKGTDPFGHLTPEQTSAMNDELQQAEVRYADRFRAANDIVDPDEKRIKLEGLRNSFGTKQSMIRKKYGVRLRERRTKAEIQAERDRMGRSEVEGPGPGRRPKAGTPGGSTPTAVARGGPASAWNAANTPQMMESAAHDAKRRRLDGGGAAPGHSSPLPHGASPLAHKPTNGNGPAANSSQVYEQSGARVEVHHPNPNAAGSGSGDDSEEAINQQLGFEEATNGDVTASEGHTTRGNSVDQAIALDDEDDDDDEDEDDSDDDEDIPAALPASVMASLGGSGR